jgi:hypothetical protein
MDLTEVGLDLESMGAKKKTGSTKASLTPGLAILTQYPDFAEERLDHGATRTNFESRSCLVLEES